MMEVFAIAGAIGAVLLLSITPTFLAAALERRKTWPYYPQYEFGDFKLAPPHAGFLRRNLTQAQKAGFSFLDRRFDGKGKRYKIIYDFLISPDGSTLAIIGAGTVVGMTVNGVWLFSKTREGNVWITVTTQSADEYDLSGLWRSRLILTRDFAKAWPYHMQTISRQFHRVDPFLQNQEIEDFRHLSLFRIETMEQRRWIRFLGEEKESWKYTIRGALKFSICSIVFGVIKAPICFIKGSFSRQLPEKLPSSMQGPS